MQANDKTFYSWATTKNEDGKFEAVVTTWRSGVPGCTELKRVPCATRARAKTHGIQWCRFLISEHNRNHPVEAV